jgi:hypothetical protein
MLEKTSRYSLPGKRKILWVYITLLELELLVIHSVSDLAPGTQNWIQKATQITHLQIPSDNFYGPGAAILMLPFSFFPEWSYLANGFYLGLGAVAIWRISQITSLSTTRWIILLSVPANFYLIWLIDSSQDTVFEFCLLSWAAFLLITRRHFLFSAIGFLLCLTRSGYWVYFLGTSLMLFIHTSMKSKIFAWKKLFAIWLLVLTSFFNSQVYGSPSPALESGMTAYFSYTKYHYLALPKMDMDVFLSGPEGAFSDSSGPVIPKGSTLAEENRIYQKAAVRSAWENKQESLLGWMQKFDSYFFDVQKVPHLPGTYVLNQQAKIIVIENDRLSWPLVLGNFLYMLYRTILLLAGLTALGIILNSVLSRGLGELKKFQLKTLALPYLFGAIPGILFYTETRFKIVSELLLVPLILEVWAYAFSRKKDPSSNS